jgi:protein involved in polysaccharide export with SLBB domain
MRFAIRRPGVGRRQWLVAAVVPVLGLAVAVMSTTAFAQATGAANPPTAVIDTLVRPTGTLRSGDLLKVRVYRDSELSGQYLIDAQGNVQIPGVGVIRAAGLDPTQITDRLVGALQTRGFRAPEIAVQPLIRVSVLGEVRTPGLFPVDPGVSLIQLLTIAGGPSERANLSRTQVIRDGRAFTVDLQSALAGSAAGQVALYSNDVVYVPTRRGAFSRDNVAFAATLAALAVSVITLIKVR